MRDETVTLPTFTAQTQYLLEQASKGSLRTRELTEDHVIWHAQDERAPVAGILLTGLLRLVRYTREGRRQILNLILPGEAFGYADKDRKSYALEAATDAKIAFLDRPWLEGKRRVDPNLRRALYTQERRMLDRLRWLTVALGVLGPEERLRAFLISAPEFMPFEPLPDGSGILSVTISRRDLADLLSTSVETICRTFKHLEALGLVELRGARRLRLIDLDGLANGIPGPDMAWTTSETGLAFDDCHQCNALCRSA